MALEVRHRLLKALAVLGEVAALLLFAASLFIMQTDAQGAFVFLLSLPLIALLLVAVMVVTAGLPREAGRRGLRAAALGIVLVVGLFIGGALTKPLEPFADALVSATRWVSVQVLGMTPWDWAHRAD